MRTSLVLATATLLLGIAAAPASAAPPVELEGTFVDNPPVVTSSRAVGDVFFFKFTSTSTFDGSLTSTAPTVSSFSCVQVAGGDLRCHGKQVFTGTIEGVGSGTTTNRIVFACSVTAGLCTGTSVIISGTGDLADVHAVFAFQVPLGTPTGTYTGQLVVP